MNMIEERTKKEERKFELVKDSSEFLHDLNTYFPKLMNYLWDQPKMISYIIQNARNRYVEEYLAPFFADNFYENILSSNYVEDNLMYILALLLESEINNLNDINQSESFLEKTPCGYLLSEIRKKKDIQAFFKTIIFDSIEDLEVNYSTYKINFDINALSDEINKKEEMKKNKNKKKKKKKEEELEKENIDDDENSKNKKKMEEDQEIFIQKYMPNLDKKAIEALLNEKKDNNILCNFLNTKLNVCNSDNNTYSNSKLIENIYKTNYPDKLIFSYQKNFSVVIEFIDIIIEKLLNNIHFLPYSLKCICKILSSLVEKKFPNISEEEKNAFIGRFFFDKLLIPILKNPGIEALINNFIISQSTLDSLNIITKIISKFSSCDLYKSTESENEYTPYNWYFIENIEKLLKIYSQLTKASLPSFIEKFLKGELPPDYEYNYFKENPDEVIRHRSIFFNLPQVKALLLSIDTVKKDIFTSKKTIGLEKTVEKLMNENNSNSLDDLIRAEKIHKKDKDKDSHSQKSKKKDNKKEIEKEQEKIPTVHYFLISSLIYNEKYEKLFNIEQETESFSIKEKKNAKDEESITQNNIIKVKNFFCSLLYNYNKLVKTDFEEGKTENTEKILTELKTLMGSPNFVADGSIPSEWYVTSLLEYLKKIPEGLTKNDCEELYKEIDKDLNNSIKDLDFEALSVIIGKLKFAKMGKIYYEKNKKLLIDIKLNEESKSIIEKDFIPVDVEFCYDDEDEEKEDVFEINVSNFKEKDRANKEKIKDYEKKQKNENLKLCTTINEFIKKFPNIEKYQDLQDADIFKIQEDLKFSEKIDNYMSIIRENISQSHKEGLEQILEKIYDYIMSKIYKKIFPGEPYAEDNKIFQQSIRLSWTEPKHFIRAKRELVYGSFLNDVFKYFNLIDTEKSPRKKILNMLEIFNSIGFLLQFNGLGKDAGVDDQMPILNYAFIKAQTLRIYSNAKFMELYIGEKKSKVEGSQLAQLLSTCNFIINLKSSDLFDVTEEEYNKKCQEASSSDFQTKK